MRSWLFLSFLPVVLALSGGNSSTTRVCKNSPDSSSWPSHNSWSAFNTSISGRLLSPRPIAAPCHKDRPEYNQAECQLVKDSWTKTLIHTEDSMSMSFFGWNNASCLPDSGSCDDAQLPAYIVNASTASHVQATVNFARKNKIRLVVRSSGHDFLGRSTAPGSISLWVKYLEGLELSDNFAPSKCGYPLNTTAITVGGGTNMEDILETLDARGLTTIAGTSRDVAVGGYISGGGHSVLSPTYGLAADNVLEVEVVTADGSVKIANECRNTDLFWAVRGGGGSTFGVITKVTLRTFPTPKIGSVNIMVLPPAEGESGYWDLITHFFQEFPRLEEMGISGYLYAIPINSSISSLSLDKPLANIVLLSQNKTSYELLLALQDLFESDMERLSWRTIRTIRPGDYSSFYQWWLHNPDTTPAGKDWVVGSRLLNGHALDGGHDTLKESLQAIGGSWGLMACLTTGRGVWNAVPRGGGNSVSPAWRNNSVVHLISAVTFEPTDPDRQRSALKELEGQLTHLRKLAPESGAYLNEAYAGEPDFEEAFWGENYSRLLEIKRQVDPDDVFWCHPCVGNDRWRPVGTKLCRV